MEKQPKIDIGVINLSLRAPSTENSPLNVVEVTPKNLVEESPHFLHKKSTIMMIDKGSVAE